VRNILVIVPTLNEKNNIIILLKKLKLTKILHDILFIDDNSKDGSQEVIKKIAKKNRNINYIFRPKKLGIGSAHKEGFVWSYKKKYKIIVTMDADGTHDPKYMKFMIQKLQRSNYDVVTTSRFLKKNSLKNWPLFRIILTTLRHIVISFLLFMPYDASGAFRCINCRKVKLKDLILTKQDSYSYFWESLFILYKKKYKISQIPIQLPYRNVGSSKMQITDVIFSLYYLMIVFVKKIFGQYNFQ
tara:strand:- start:308 stop:1036 length:729 start_codon:yes stop_codon:yes gene_type:complete